MSRVSESTTEGFRTFTIENDSLRYSVVPELGGNGISLLMKQTGREYLWRNPATPYRRRTYDDLYANDDPSGWDECFPSIGSVFYPAYPWQGVRVPDHGELWCLPWQVDASDGTLKLWVDGIRFPYRFEKQFTSVNDQTLRVRYTVRNRAPYSFRCFWSAHPMLVVKPTNRLLLPGTPLITVEHSPSGRLGPYLSQHRWPITKDSTGSPFDLRTIGATNPGVGDKLYTSELAEGWAALYDAESTEYLLMEFPRDTIPFVGFLALSARPSASESWFIFALEPCSGWPDRLDVALERGSHWILAPYGVISWHLDVTLGQGLAALRDRIGASLDVTVEEARP